MSKILIVEDQVLIAHFLKDTLLKEGYNQIEIALNIKQATEFISNYNPEIILLDINVEGKDSGISWAENYAKGHKVIFVTAQTERETLQKALQIKPLAYLTKPIKKIELLAAVQLAQNNFKKNYIVIKDGYNELKINFDEILFIKSDKNYIDIQTHNRKITSRNSLDQILNEINDDNFCRVHRSYIINKQKVTIKSSNFVKIENFEIPISRDITIDF